MPVKKSFNFYICLMQISLAITLSIFIKYLKIPKMNDFHYSLNYSSPSNWFHDTDDQTLHSSATVNGHWRWISLNYQPTCSKCWKSQAWQLHLLCFHQTLNNHLPPGSSHVTGFGDGCRVDVVNKSTAKLRHFLRCCHSQSMF